MQKSFVVAIALLGAAPVAQAQNYDRPPADVEERGYGGAGAPDASSMLRIDRLENQVRSLNGQVEQLQYQLKRMDEQLRKFQMDVDMRLQDAGHGARPAGALPQRRSDLPEGLAPQQAAEALPAAAPAVSPDGRRHDAFDPSAQPSAPGAPVALGSPESVSRPVARAASNGPLDLTPPGLREPGLRDPGLRDPLPPTAAPGAMASMDSNASGALPPADPIKAEYDAAVEQLKAQRYDGAQQSFAAFVEKNPHSRYIAPAIYHLGESFSYQSRHREAAEQFLKIAQDYARSPVAASAMVKLGVSLAALGAKEQACAFFAEMPRKYPAASAGEKQAAAREAKKAAC